MASPPQTTGGAEYGYPPGSSGNAAPATTYHHVPQPPQMHSTSVTVNTDPTPAGAGRVVEINLDIGYFKTMPGILKIVQLVLGIFCMACASPVRASRFRSSGHNSWFLFVVVTTFIVSLVLVFVYLLKLKETVRFNVPLSMLKLEFYYTTVATALYAVAFIVIFSGFGHCAGYSICDARIAAGVICISSIPNVFGLLNTLAYGVAAYILLNETRNTPPELQ